MTGVIASFHWRGDFYIVTGDGAIYRLDTNDSNHPAQWRFTFVVNLYHLGG